MSLITLIAYDYGINNYTVGKKAHEISEVYLNYMHDPNRTINQTIKINLSRSSDSFILKHFEIHTVDNIEQSELKKIINNGFLKIRLLTNDGPELITYHFGLLFELEPVKKINNVFILKIPFEYTLNKLHMQASQLTNFFLEINIPNPHMIKNIKLYQDMLYFHDNMRLHLKNCTHFFEIQTFDFISNFKFHSSNKKYTLKCDLLKHTQSKGYFFNGDFNSVKTLIIKNKTGDIFLNYDKNHKDLKIQKISNNLYWITNTSNNDFSYKIIDYSNELSPYDFHDGVAEIEFDQDYLQHTINSDDIVCDFSIYSVSQKIMIYHAGMIDFVKSTHDLIQKTTKDAFFNMHVTRNNNIYDF